MNQQEQTNAFSRRKNRRKVIRVTIQTSILIVLVWLYLNATVFAKTYTSPDASTYMQRDQGFIALSYFGVAPTANETLISQQRLSEHLNALRVAGYVTITQQDIYDYYYNGKALPERALFLFFEDGRRESSLLAQELLKENNYCASMLSYANNLDGRNTLFLSARDLLNLENTSYWELGTNGYRLSYINVFDRHENYMGELTPIEYYKISPYVRREYNHYLMDFLRDEYDIPMESHAQMQQRIEDDYRLMDSIYREKCKRLPRLYAIMHANTGQFATNDRVSVENEIWMSELFDINFNREMLSLNDLSSDIYDLTRMQPQAYWSTNHLLMRISYDIEQDLPFIVGDEQKAAQWELIEGAAEFAEDTIYLTTIPEDLGMIRLRDIGAMDNFTLSVQMLGNKLGIQSIDLLTGTTSDSYIAVELNRNILRIYPSSGGGEGEALFELDLDVHDEIVYQTWEENRQEAMEVEIQEKLRQTYKPIESKRIAETLIKDKANVADANHEPYIPEITLKDAGDRQVDISVSNGLLSVTIDGKPAAMNIPMDGASVSGISLRSAWAEYGYSQRNLADDVYDGVFRSLMITRHSDPSQSDEGLVVLDYRKPDPTTVQIARQAWDTATTWVRRTWAELKWVD